MNPELSRPFLLDKLTPAGQTVEVAADEPERLALAERLRIPSVQSLVCRFNLRRLPGGRIAVDGRLRATLMQTCVITLDDFSAPVAEDFSLLFVPAGRESEGSESDPDAPDEIAYAGNTIDLGEAAAEQLALVLDPYPRSPGAVLPEDLSDDQSASFAELAKRKRPN